MRRVLLELLENQKPSLHSCPVCPVKGACVFVTPGYEPSYCLHEYKLLHAFLAQRLREHPPAGSIPYSRLFEETQAYVERLRRERPYNPSRGPMARIPAPLHWPPQSTLIDFGFHSN